MAVATLAMLGTTATSVAPIELTEAAWTDSVHANAAFTASIHAGVNYARAAASNGGMDWVRNYPISGTVAEVSTLAVPTHKDTGNTPFSVDTFASILEFDSNARSCARVDSSLCATDPTGPPAAPAFAESEFNTMELRLPGDAWLVRYVGGPNNPIRTTASCTPGVDGTPAVAGGAGIRLRTGRGTNNYSTIAVPTINGTTPAVDGSYLGGIRYTTTITSILEKRRNFARAEIRLKIVARDYGVLTHWTLDILLVRAECGLSQPLAGGIVTAVSGRPEAMNPSPEVAQVGDPESDEAAIPQNKLTDTPISPTSTSAPPNPSGEDEATNAAANTAPTTSPTRRTTTVTSAVPTVSAAPTNTTTPPATKTLTSTSAAPAVVIPDEPGTLSPTARLEDVGVVTVSGEGFVVVVQGTTVPTDGQQGLAALEIWLGGGDPGDTWATFTSTDSDADGWRWAAINQETGTVVYIR
ncbi:hypothetical protein [uncultured Dietzia sp.]|uniref:hypothetical protein n=1 Tax=uncultured Dietzia sp. TaxID=395519 RepID=UPI0030FA2AD5